MPTNHNITQQITSYFGIEEIRTAIIGGMIFDTKRMLVPSLDFPDYLYEPVLSEEYPAPENQRLMLADLWLTFLPDTSIDKLQDSTLCGPDGQKWLSICGVHTGNQLWVPMRMSDVTAHLSLHPGGTPLPGEITSLSTSLYRRGALSPEWTTERPMIKWFIKKPGPIEDRDFVFIFAGSPDVFRGDDTLKVKAARKMMKNQMIYLRNQLNITTITEVVNLIIKQRNISEIIGSL